MFYTYTYRKYRANFIHGVSVRKMTDVLQCGSTRQLVPYLRHDCVCELFHAFRCSAHAHKLKKRTILIYSMDKENGHGFELVLLVN